MVSTRAIDFQLCNSQGKAIAFSGGVAQICTAGSPDKTPTVYDINQAVIANPVALVRGRLYCEVPKAVGSVDIYMSTPTGHFVVLKGVVPGDRQEVRYDPLDLMSTWVIPFSISDSVANVEKDTGFDFVAGSHVHGIASGIEVTATDAAITINYGTLSTESGGDADGFGIALSCATAGNVGAVTVGTDTLGALLKEVSGTDLVPKSHIVTAANPSISYTLLVAADTAKGFIHFNVTVAKISALAAAA